MEVIRQMLGHSISAAESSAILSPDPVWSLFFPLHPHLAQQSHLQRWLGNFDRRGSPEHVTVDQGSVVEPRFSPKNKFLGGFVDLFGSGCVFPVEV